MRQPRSLWVLGLVLSFIMTLAVPAWARAPLVLMLETPDNEAVTELVTRVEGELVAAGADVRRVARPSAVLDPASRVLVSSEALAAVAAIEIEVLPEGGVRIWIADRLGPEPIVHHLDVGLSAGTDEKTAAVRAAELLRVSFLQRLMDASNAPPPRPEGPPQKPRPEPPPAPPPAAEPGASGGLELGPALLSSFQGMGHQVALAARISYFPVESVGLRLNLLGLGRATLVEAAAGSANLEQQLAYLDVAWLFGSRPVRPLLSAGIGAYHLDVEGIGGPGFVGKSEDFLGVSAVFGAGAVVSLAASVTLSFSLNAVLVFPEPLVHLDETAAARAGRPSLLGNSLLGAWF